MLPASVFTCFRWWFGIQLLGICWNLGDAPEAPSYEHPWPCLSGLIGLKIDLLDRFTYEIFFLGYHSKCLTYLPFMGRFFHIKIQRHHHISWHQWRQVPIGCPVVLANGGASKLLPIARMNGRWASRAMGWAAGPWPRRSAPVGVAVGTLR